MNDEYLKEVDVGKACVVLGLTGHTAHGSTGPCGSNKRVPNRGMKFPAQNQKNKTKPNTIPFSLLMHAHRVTNNH